MKNTTGSTWLRSFSTDPAKEDIIQEDKLPLSLSQQKTIPEKPFMTKQSTVQQDCFQENSTPEDSRENTHTVSDESILPSNVRVDQSEVTKERNVSTEPKTSREHNLLRDGEKKILPRKTRKANNFSSININELKKTFPSKQDIEQVLPTKDEEKSALPAENENSNIEKNKSELEDWERKCDTAACKIQAWWKGTLTRILLTGALVERRLRYNHQGKELGINTKTDPYGHFVLFNDSYSTNKLSLKTDSIKPWPRSHVALLCDFLDTLKVNNKSLKPSYTIQGVYTNKLKESYSLEVSRHVVDIVKQLEISESQRKEIETLWELNDETNVDYMK